MIWILTYSVNQTDLKNCINDFINVMCQCSPGILLLKLKLFARGEHICSRSKGNDLGGIAIGARSTTERGFTGVVVTMGGVVVVFGDMLVFLPLCAKCIVTSLNIVKPLLKVHNFVQFFRGNLL
jgi:hypothetical protein